MNLQKLKANALLLLTAAIWGFAFVAQRAGMEHVEPFTFNGIRFALGALSLIPLMAFMRRNEKSTGGSGSRPNMKTLITGGALAGTAIFMGASLQQVGIVYTTAGKAGFITGLYVVIVPILGLFWRHVPDRATWAGAVLAAAGLYYLCITEAFTMVFGDLLEFVGAFFWAGHVLIIGVFSRKIDPIQLAFIQFSVCSILSLITAFIFETLSLQGILNAAIPILYGGLISVGIAYTLQVVAQKNADPAHAAIILSMESPVAALGGWIILGEMLSSRSLWGCGLMLTGMIISQIQPVLARPRSCEAGVPL
jgi:drug/metabolite transporter (DMT)-like permease